MKKLFYLYLILVFSSCVVFRSVAEIRGEKEVNQEALSIYDDGLPKSGKFFYYACGKDTAFFRESFFPLTGVSEKDYNRAVYCLYDQHFNGDKSAEEYLISFYNASKRKSNEGFFPMIYESGVDQKRIKYRGKKMFEILLKIDSGPVRTYDDVATPLGFDFAGFYIEMIDTIIGHPTYDEAYEQVYWDIIDSGDDMLIEEMKFRHNYFKSAWDEGRIKLKDYGEE